MSESKIIMFDSDEAARKVAVTGWVSNDGRFYRYAFELAGLSVYEWPTEEEKTALNHAKNSA